jgi:hypothetical protein
MFALLLFARVRLPVLEERVLQIAGDDAGDFANERAVDALVRLGTPEVVAAVEAGLPSRTDAFRVFAPSVLARIKRPASEDAFVRLIEREDGLVDPTFVAMHLCKLATTSREALGVIEQMVVVGAYNRIFVNLDVLLLAVGQMVGWKPTDPAAWEAQPMRVRPKPAQPPAPQPPAPSMKTRGFVPYGKKARRKKKG